MQIPLIPATKKKEKRFGTSNETFLSNVKQTVELETKSFTGHFKVK